MSKGQRGNKEAKKPKKLRPAVKPVLSEGATPSAGSVAVSPQRKK